MIPEYLMAKRIFITTLRSAFFFLLFSVLHLYGHTHTIQNNRTSYFQAVVDRTFPGDTLNVPAGIYMVDTAVHLKHGLTVIGAGIDKTVFVFDTNHNASWVFKVVWKNKGKLRFTGFTIKGCAPRLSSGIQIKNSCQDFRIDNCKFVNCIKRAIEVHGDSRGVIDHNVFIDNWYTSVVVFGDGERSWLRPLSLGSGDAVYVEDNYFRQNNIGNRTQAHHIASNNGSRYVFRYNTINDGDILSHAIDAHGNKYGWKRGSRSYEIYRNKISAVHRWAGINIRGGDGVIFENKITGKFISPLHLMHEGRDGDGNCIYPCLDQIFKLYVWQNDCNGKDIVIKIRHPELIQYKRNVILENMPGYKPYRYPHPLVK